jgi:hypothetical protein
MTLSWNEIQDRAAEFASKWQGETYEKGESQSFWSDFLTVFGIDRRRHGAFFEYAIKKGSGAQGFIDMFWPGKLLAEQKSGGKDLTKASIQAYEYLETMPDHDLPEAIVVSDFTSFVFILNDGTNQKTEFALADFPKHVKLFGFLINQASQKLAEEDPVNRNAAEAMARLHNQLRDDNYTGHDLELLLVRLVFCMFADDSGIFDHGILQAYLNERTSDDGSDLGPRLVQVFQTLNTPIEQRQSSLDEVIASLPYVNGGLFAESVQTPYFNSEMRRDLLNAMKLDWSKVSPAIFGSMFQGVMDEKERRNLGAHYTSEKNILRVIKPLFLDDLYQEFAHALRSGPRKKYGELRTLQDKLAELKFLDPACGSGNFLVITYRELRRLEHKIVAQLAKDAGQQDMLASAGQGVGTLKVNVDQMYGIEIDEFPSLIAQTAIWLTDHQMNVEYSHQSGRTFKRLPLTRSATIVNDNALTKDWAEVIAPSELDYILGNPPFVGKNQRDDEQADAMSRVFADINDGWKSLDFVSSWHVKACKYMKQNTHIQAALVSTNSITQGEQVPVLWPYLKSLGVNLNFAHKTFQWQNDAKGVAAVHCVILGFALFDRPEKIIFEYTDIKAEPIEVLANNINPYLVDASDVIVYPRMKPISNVSQMINGSKPADGGFLLLTPGERADILATEPQAKKYIKKLVGADEFLNNGERYCLWLVDCPPQELRAMPKVMQHVEGVRAFRAASKKPQTRELANTPTLFAEIRAQKEGSYLLVPKVTSENRSYAPIGFMSHEVISTDRNHTIPNATLYEFGILSSKMHMSWLASVCGRLESRFNYSSKLVYNTFIWPEVTETQTNEIEALAQAILDARAEFPDASLADLYDPLTMPPALAKAHKALDRAVDKLYQKSPFATDAERVAMLFEKYQGVTREN